MMNDGLVRTVLGLQVFIVAFLLLHDWIPLGRLNNVAALRGEDSLQKRLLTTVLSALPFALGLWFTVSHGNGPTVPGWVKQYLWWSYALLFLGQLRAWWIPYLGKADPVRAARYQVLFANTLTFLPEKNGISPNVLHVILHVATVVLLALIPYL
jgi:hypothetical protein